jgi:hypothetical protein
MLTQFINKEAENQTLGVEKLPPQFLTNTVSASIADSPGLIQYDRNGQRVVVVNGRMPKGWKLWSLTCKWPSVIAESNDDNYSMKEVIIKDSVKNYPVILVPKNFF